MKRVSIRMRTAITFAVASAAITSVALIAAAAVMQSPLVVSLVAEDLDSMPTGVAPSPVSSPTSVETSGPTGPSDTLAPGGPSESFAQVAEHFAARQWTVSAAAVVMAALLAGAVGWAAAGAALRPLNRMTRRAETIDADNLHARIAWEGPSDELMRLSLSFDQLLERLEESFAAQARFVAFASHELRTPLAVQRALVEIGLDDPSPEEREQVREQLLVHNRQSEMMVAGLLSLAQSQGSALEKSTFDLSEIVQREIDSAVPAIEAASLMLERDLAPMEVLADQALTRTMIRNLIQNAVTHNRHNGKLRIVIPPEDDALEISNDGGQVPAEAIERILQPFVRIDETSANREDHHGLGLAIISTIARRHGWTINLSPRDEGGLTIRVQIERTVVVHSDR